MNKRKRGQEESGVLWVFHLLLKEWQKRIGKSWEAIAVLSSSCSLSASHLLICTTCKYLGRATKSLFLGTISRNTSIHHTTVLSREQTHEDKKEVAVGWLLLPCLQHGWGGSALCWWDWSEGSCHSLELKTIANPITCDVSCPPLSQGCRVSSRS